MRALLTPLLAALVLSLAGCHLLLPGPVRPFRPEPAGHVRTVSLCTTTCTDSVDIVAMGVGGFLIVPWRDTTQLVMTPPAFSNPGAVRVALLDYVRGVRSNRTRVLASVRRNAHADSARLSRVRGVLVGHGHYDHLMDLPTLAPWLASARVYSSTTVQHMLHSVRTTLPTVSAEDRMASSAESTGASIRISSGVTARAVLWSHAPNIWDFGLRYTIAAGQQPEPRNSLPDRARQWKMGTVLAWVVDIHDDRGNVVLRLFLHDSAAPRDDMLRAAAVVHTMPPARATVAMIIPANYDNAAGYPDVLLATLQPDHVLLAHWEDFFRRPSQPLRIVRAIDGDAFADILQKFVGTRWSALAPGAVFRIRTGSTTP